MVNVVHVEEKIGNGGEKCKFFGNDENLEICRKQSPLSPLVGHLTGHARGFCQREFRENVVVAIVLLKMGKQNTKGG